ncbi:MAG: class II fumarate hydratase [Tissierellia bacterium]|nr:class II fumarate hydratase [Tissierellia bacterium]
MKKRIEKDSMGEVEVDANALWKAQTQRSLNNFKIGNEKMPYEIIHALLNIKKACAIANFKTDNLEKKKSELIVKAVDEVIENDYKQAFPLCLWQTGSGTQTNMNVNEVLSSVCNKLDDSISIHPNDDINKSQSTNDTFPSAMHIATILETNKLIKKIEVLISSIKNIEDQNKNIVKIGRTHLQDAVPLKFSDVFSAFRSAFENDLEFIKNANEKLLEIPIGGSAVGSGLNVKKSYDKIVCENLSKQLNLNIKPMENKFYGLSYKSLFSNLHSSFNTLATDLFKMANDIRYLSSGPRCGIGEIIIPSNEPGSSIMPGKVNPTQAEALIQVCAQVMGNNTIISISNSSGNFELNVFMPLIANTMLQSARILTDAINSFVIHLLDGLKANEKKIDYYLKNSLMLVTALSPHIGYDKASKLAKYAHEEDISLKEANKKLKFIEDNKFDELTNPNNMI